MNHDHPADDDMTILDMLLCDECATHAFAAIADDDLDDIHDMRRTQLIDLDPADLADMIAHCAYPPYEPRSARESITDLALNLSLCPMHLIDYAICFDDLDPECATIRMIHPCCDT